MTADLSGSLTKIRRLNYRQTMVKSLGQLAAVDLFAVTALFILDNLTAFSVDLRLTALVVFILANAAGLVKSGRDLYKARLTDRQAALKLEQLYGIRDNALINAVCFRADKNISPELRAAFLTAADARCARLKLAGIWHNKTCRRVLRILLAALTVAALYLVTLHRYACNAARRFANPWTQLAALNFTQFDVAPGDVRLAAGRDLPVRATASRAGQQLTDLKILLTAGGISTLCPMRYRAGSAAFTISNITGNMTYKILAGNDSSREFSVKVVPAPRFSSLAIEIVPPAYTRLKHAVYDLRASEITAPAGSEIRISGRAAGNKIALTLDRRPESCSLPCSFKLTEDLLVRAAIRRDGIDYPDVWRCIFHAKTDAPPRLRFLNRQTNIEAGLGQTVPLYIQAEDDYGVSALRVIVANQGRKGVYKCFDYGPAPFPVVREAVLLKLTPEMGSADTVLEVALQARDSRRPPQTGNSEVNLTIHITDLVKKFRENLPADADSGLYQLLFKTIARQEEVRNWLAVRVKTLRRWEVSYLVNRQREIKQLLAAARDKAEKLHKDFVPRLRQIVDGQAELLVAGAGRLFRDDRTGMEREVNQLIDGQSALIRQLNALLGTAAGAELRNKAQQQLKAEAEQEKDFFAKLKKLRGKLDEFMQAQTKIIAETEAVDRKKPEDWTDKEEKLLGDLAARELDWSRFFQAAFNDLSKLQRQDFSNSAMADEFVEMYEELQKAAAALAKKKSLEIATLAEDTALNSSQAVAANLDRWLADNKDNIKWNAEENGETPDIPLTDLPAELTDIIGDLIEQETDMTDDSQDSTNSFSYSSDEGLGWGVSDGNIDSMQAKGITGNILPNNNEAGGRSGEGRSGKSSGQFVEKTATGKGGRKTPARLTRSPYEKGTVNDTSKDAQGGASGGGKQSGIGGEGLIGVTPEQDPEIKTRLGGNQGELRQRAEALFRKLGERQLPTGELREALNKMALLQQLPPKGRETEVQQLKREIVRAVRDARTALLLSINASREKVRRQKKRDFTVKYQRREKIPAEFEDCAGAYFKALAAEE
ncbi:MAG: hypothetical protein PHH77_03590 [Victivallaceae bacterium]|nr:hypothetical protein [Victivallaceae bacterium]